MITKEMMIADIISIYPETLPIFKQYNLDCYECQIADLESLGHGADVHKIDINQLLSSLNKVLSH